MVHSALLQHNVPTGIPDRMSNHGSKMCRVLMQPGQDVFARAGSMVAYEGLLDFVPNPPQLKSIMKSWATGEGVPLMIAQGQGHLYLTDYGKDVIVMQLVGEGISVNGKSVLAFDASLQWGIERVKGVSLLAGHGMFNVVLRGHGWVAITRRGTPVMLDTREAPTYVDTDALVAFTEGLKITPKRTARLGAVFGRDTGEAFQLGFQGQGFVVVQPAEDQRA